MQIGRVDASIQIDVSMHGGMCVCVFLFVCVTVSEWACECDKVVYANFNNSVCQQNCSDQENEIHVSPKASIVDHTANVLVCAYVCVFVLLLNAWCL